MKRHLFLFLLLQSVWFSSIGQVATNYVFTQTQGVFEPISGGTVLWSGTFNNNAAVEVAIPSFTFDGNSYTSLFISENGFVTFGASPANNNISPLNNTGNYSGAISAFGANLHQALSGTPEVRYQLLGNDFVVQWKDVRRYFVYGEIISFQIRLHISSNSISVIYGGEIASGSNSVFPQVGLRGPDNTFGTNINNRTITIDGGNWINSAPGTANNSTMYFRSTAPDTKPAPGLAFKWSPGVYIPCYTPTNISVSSITTTSALFTWNAPNPIPPEGYEFEIRTQGEPGSGAIGLEATNIVSSGETSVFVDNLGVATAYSFYIRSYCGPDNYSLWSNALDFNTLCLPVTVFPLIEGFDADNFPPVCWTNVQVAGGGLWGRSTQGANPTISPYDGNGMLTYNCFNYYEGTSAAFVSPTMELPAGDYTIGFMMYRDNGYASSADRVNVVINQSPTPTGGITLGTVHRSAVLAPAVPEPGWYPYEFSFSLPTDISGYFMLVGISEYGNNIFIDNLSISEVANVELSWFNLQWPASATIALNEEVTVYAQCWEDGVTNQPGQGEGIEAWIGYSTENSNPNTWTDWIPAYYNVDDGNNDEYMAALGYPQSLPEGVYYYASRFRYQGGPFTYGGYNVAGGGEWDGINNLSGILTVTPCGLFQLPVYEGFEGVNTPNLPVCWDKYINSTSTYPYIETTQSGGPTAGQKHVVMYNSNDAASQMYFVSPMIEEPLNETRILFYAKGNNGQTLEVGAYDGNDFEVIETLTLSLSYQQYYVSFAAYSGTHNRIAFKHGLGGTFKPIYLDEITIEVLPPPCSVPISQAMNLTLTSTTNSVTGSFEVSDANGYLVLQHTTTNLGAIPANTIRYQPGDQLGTGIVISNNQTSSFTVPNLNPFTQYYYTVFAFNHDISCNGPTYKTAGPLTGNIKTKPDAPQVFTANAISTSAVSFQASPNNNGHNIIVAWNTEDVFGNPSGAYNVGNMIQGGGTVHYVGNASGLYNHTGLSEGTRYYYRVWSVVAGPIYSSNFIGASAITPCNPFVDFPQTESFESGIFPPQCWLSQQESGTGMWEASTTGLYPTVAPFDGSTMLRFRSYDFTNGTSSNLISPGYLFGTEDYRIRLWMYRDGGYSNNTDRINVYLSSTQSTTNAQLLGTVHRSLTLEPIENNEGWYEYTFNVPEDYNGLGYFILQAVSDFGNNMYMDLIKVEEIPTTAVLYVSPISHDFGEVSIFDSSIPQQFNLTNDGIGNVQITAISLSGQDASDFTLDDSNTYPIAIAAGETYNFSVVFDPENTGLKTAFVTIEEQGGNQATTQLPLVGVGIDPTIVDFPWHEGFEEGFPPAGWANNNWEDSKFGVARTGVHFAYSNNAGSSLISPPIQLPESELIYTFSFWYRAESNQYPQDFEVSLSTDGINYNFSLFQGNGIVTTNYTEFSYELSAFAGQTIFIKFAGNTGTGGYDYGILIDDVLINTPLVVTHEFTPLSCYQSNDGTISLDIVGGATPYTIVWTGPDGFASNQQYLTGLAAGQYQYSVTDGDGIVASDFVTLTQPDEVPAPQIGDTEFVYDGTVQTVEAVAPAETELVWYDAPEGGEVIEAPMASDAGIYPAWVAAFDAEIGCESARIDATMTIDPRELTVTADDQSKCQNTENPELSLTYEGFAAGEDVENLETAPEASTTATLNSLPGEYPITVSGGISNNYAFNYENGTLTVIASPIVDAGDDGSVCVNEAFPIVDASASNFSTVLWSSSGNGSFSDANAVNPIYTPGSADITNGFVTLTLTGDPGSPCSMSDDMVLTIQNDLPVSVTISLNTPEICNGTLVSFSVMPVNGGLAPSYQWKVNGTNAGTDSPNFEYVPADGDVVTVVLTSSIGCALNNPATSNAITVNVTPDLTAEVSIDADATEVCDFTPVTFTAYPVNGGMNPSYQWLVNGEAAGTNSATFTYAPLDGDAVSVVMNSSHLCAVVPVATSNVVTMSVAPPLLVLVPSPANGGTVSGGGNYADGSVVTVTATPSSGWEFLNWRNMDGEVVSTDATFDYTINMCYDELVATFSSTARIAGQLKYFNALETTIPSAGNNIQFYVQLFENGEPHSDRQLVKYNATQGLDSYFEFIGAESGKDYTLKIYEQPTSNLLGNTWAWNNWGGASSVDALIISYMSVGNPVVSSYPWILPEGASDYTALFNNVADVTGDGNILGSDPLALMFRTIGLPGYNPFPGGTHNFQLATTKLAAHTEKAHPAAPEVLFAQNGTYTAASPASSVYYEAELTNLNDGLNVFNVYFVATGDMNTSYVPGTAAKASVNLSFDNIIAANVGDEILIPVVINQAAELGAVSLGLSYNTDLIEVVDVLGYDIVNIDAEAGSVRVAWMDQLGKAYGSGQEILVLKAKVLADMQAGTAYMSLMSDTEFGDRQANVLHDISLSTSYIETGVTSIGNLSDLKLNHRIFPNPFNDATQIQYTLPVAGKVRVDVYNHLGQLVITLADELQQAGAHKLLLNNYDLTGAGSYFYQISVNAEGQSFTERGTIVLTK